MSSASNVGPVPATRTATGKHASRASRAGESCSACWRG